MLGTFIMTTLSLIFTVFLGVTGNVSNLEVRDDFILVNTSYNAGLSIGGFVFVGNNFAPIMSYGAKPIPREDIIKHERGHMLQEKMLGSGLYLIIVAIPSMRAAWRANNFRASPANYFNQWPENWANDLGEVSI